MDSSPSSIQQNTCCLSNNRKLLHVCSRCHRTFKDINNFREHLFQEHGEKYLNVRQCKLCSYATLLKSKYDCHMRCHLNNRIIKCNKCDYSTINIRHMSKHERMHVGEMAKQQHVSNDSDNHYQEQLNSSIVKKARYNWSDAMNSYHQLLDKIKCRTSSTTYENVEQTITNFLPFVPLDASSNNSILSILNSNEYTKEIRKHMNQKYTSDKITYGESEETNINNKRIFPDDNMASASNTKDDDIRSNNLPLPSYNINNDSVVNSCAPTSECNSTLFHIDQSSSSNEQTTGNSINNHLSPPTISSPRIHENAQQSRVISSTDCLSAPDPKIDTSSNSSSTTSVLAACTSDMECTATTSCLHRNDLISLRRNVFHMLSLFMPHLTVCFPFMSAFNPEQSYIDKIVEDLIRFQTCTSTPTSHTFL
ncbi:unnamed protein product [Didymodactylos carnosus]|uniref:C2H2-type domain-containing protein n=1 Tax=Didymodactylos carnosus TaxID=1234261 RepID=A0A813R8S5_9BILA|nr:unnamed protein product [Didymodactylos carnosus]CAF3559466.1 unnamed protein product [Didymodactylos carnosus]